MYKLALLTGSSSGLGAALAAALSARGIELLLPTRPAYDLNDPSPLLSLIRARQPDLVINNAGFTIYGDCLDVYDAQHSIFAVNAAAVHAITLEAARTLRTANRTGTILNISSAAALFSFPGMATYAAAKAFVASFSQSLDAELRLHGIRVLTTLPGQINTSFATRAAHNPDLRPSRLTLSPARAAALILRQLDRLQPYAIIDWRTRLLARLSHLLPQRLVERALHQTIRERCLKNDSP